MSDSHELYKLSEIFEIESIASEIIFNLLDSRDILNLIVSSKSLSNVILIIKNILCWINKYEILGKVCSIDLSCFKAKPQIYNYPLMIWVRGFNSLVYNTNQRDVKYNNLMSPYPQNILFEYIRRNNRIELEESAKYLKSAIVERNVEVLEVFLSKHKINTETFMRLLCNDNPKNTEKTVKIMLSMLRNHMTQKYVSCNSTIVMMDFLSDIQYFDVMKDAFESSDPKNREELLINMLTSGNMKRDKPSEGRVIMFKWLELETKKCIIKNGIIKEHIMNGSVLEESGIGAFLTNTFIVDRSIANDKSNNNYIKRMYSFAFQYADNKYLLDLYRRFPKMIDSDIITKNIKLFDETSMHIVVDYIKEIDIFNLQRILFKSIENDNLLTTKIILDKIKLDDIHLINTNTFTLCRSIPMVKLLLDYGIRGLRASTILNVMLLNSEKVELILELSGVDISKIIDLIIPILILSKGSDISLETLRAFLKNPIINPTIQKCLSVRIALTKNAINVFALLISDPRIRSEWEKYLDIVSKEDISNDLIDFLKSYLMSEYNINEECSMPDSPVCVVRRITGCFELVNNGGFVEWINQYKTSLIPESSTCLEDSRSFTCPKCKRICYHPFMSNRKNYDSCSDERSFNRRRLSCYDNPNKSHDTLSDSFFTDDSLDNSSDNSSDNGNDFSSDYSTDDTERNSSVSDTDDETKLEDYANHCHEDKADKYFLSRYGITFDCDPSKNSDHSDTEPSD